MGQPRREREENWLAQVESAVADAELDLTTLLGGHRESTHARLWRGQVLVDWEADDLAGGCLVRPGLLRRLLMLQARVRRFEGRVEVQASGRVLASLSQEHAELVERLGGADAVELRATLRFEGEHYRGGEEVYAVFDGRRAHPLLRLTARLRSASPRTSPATR